MEKEQQYKKMLITVNGEPIGKEIWIDRITYAPVLASDLTAEAAGSDTETAAVS